MFSSSANAVSQNQVWKEGVLGMGMRPAQQGEASTTRNRGRHDDIADYFAYLPPPKHLTCSISHANKQTNTHKHRRQGMLGKHKNTDRGEHHSETH